MTNTPFNPIQNLGSFVAHQEAIAQPVLQYRGRFLMPYDPLLGLGLVGSAAGDFHLLIDGSDVLGAIDRSEEAEAHLTTSFEALAQDPDRRGVTGLVVYDWCGDGLDEPDFAEGEAPLALSTLLKKLPALRSLYIGDPLKTHSPTFEARIGPLGSYLRAAPQLTHLHARGSWISGPYVHGRLQRLTLETEEFWGLMDDLSRAALPALRRLDLRLESLYDELDLDAIAPLFSGHLLPRLHHLEISHCTDADALVERLIGSPLWSRLHTFELPHSALTDWGAELILSAASITSIEVLSLEGAELSPHLHTALAEGPWRYHTDDAHPS